MTSILKDLLNKPTKLIEFLTEFLKPKEIEKKIYGEVFTPFQLINEMLDKLDKYYKKENDEKSIFSDSTLKWYDPASGLGNFPVVIYQRLIKGLKSEFPSIKKRREHIIKNMLYMGELNKKNCHIIKQIFGENVNLYEGNSLETEKVWEYFDFKEKFKFDVIIGNPPYNKSGAKATGNTIWQLFVKKFINKINNYKYLCFIHPSGWRKPCYEKSQLKNLFNILTKENQMLYLEIHGIKDGKKTFHCDTKYDWYIVKNIKIYKETDIKDENNVLIKINMNSWDWLPNFNINSVYKILKKNTTDAGLDVIMDSSYHATRKYVSNKKTGIFQYPLIHSTPKSGIRYMYSEFNNKGHFNIPKIIFGEAGINDIIIDYEGNYGMTQGAMAIKINSYDEGVLFKKCLLSEEFNKFLEACRFGNFRIDWKLFSYLKKDFYKKFID